MQYKPDPNNPNETLAIKEIWIESGLYGLRYVTLHFTILYINLDVWYAQPSFRSAVKNFGVERFKQNCTKATEGFNIVLEHWRYLRTVNHQNYLKTIPLRKWQEMMMKKDNIREKICAKRLTVEESWKFIMQVIAPISFLFIQILNLHFINHSSISVEIERSAIVLKKIQHLHTDEHWTRVSFCVRFNKHRS